MLRFLGDTFLHESVEGLLLNVKPSDLLNSEPMV